MREANKLLKKEGGRVFAVLNFVFIFVILFLYGFQASFDQTSDSTIRDVTLAFMQNVFTLVGFGLILTNSRSGLLTGMSIVLFVVSFNFLLAPLWQDVYTKSLLKLQNGDNEPSRVAPTAQDFWSQSVLNTLSIGSLSVKISSLCSISYLVGMTGYSGRINIICLPITLLVFNILFHLNFYLNVLINFRITNKTEVFRYLDDYGSYLVYLFGAIYGLLVSVMTRNKDQNAQENAKPSRLNTVLGLVGSFFIFSTFIFTSTDIIQGTGNGKNYRFNAGPFIILFASVNAMIGNYIGCALSGKGKVSVPSLTIGTLAGGILIGALAGAIQNVSAALIVGILGGILLGVLMTKVHEKLNENGILDSQGLVSGVLTMALIGTFIVPPSIINQYFAQNENLTLFFINQTSEEDGQIASYQLAYFGVTVALALVTGLLLGLVTKMTNDQSTDFQNQKFFIADFGLYQVETRVAGQEAVIESSSSLKPDVN